MTQTPSPPTSWWNIIQNLYPELRHVVTFTSGVLVTIGVMKAPDQATLLDAFTHIGADLADIGKYLGIIGAVIMPILAKNSGTVVNMIASLKRKAPEVVVVAPPVIADKSAAQSTADVAVVSKVSGEEVKPT